MPRHDCYDHPRSGCLECSWHTNDLEDRVRDLGLRTHDIEQTFVPLMTALVAAVLSMMGNQQRPNRGIAP